MLSDSRLLNNLLKTEKDSQKSFNQWTKDAASASSALSAWAVADSGETQDLMDVSMRITQLLANCADSQRRYLSSLSVYRSSLKQVLERESTLRTVVRDREILVGRLIKLGNKKPGDSAIETHQLKLEDAQRELAACESCLQSEQAALGEVKRRIFRESLSARMKSMGELGMTMEESAKEAMELLSQLGQGYEGEGYNIDGLGSQAGDSITPSLSASQALSQSSLYSSDDEDDHVPHQVNIPAPHQLSQSTSLIPTYFPTSASSTVLQNGSATPTRASTITSTRPRQRTSSTPILPSVPVAARGAPSPMPFIEIPKAPTNVGSRRPTDDSSDEEDEQAFVSMSNGNTRATTSRNAPSAADSPPKRFLRRRAHSDTSTITDRNRVGREPTKRTGFFGGLASLFKRAPPRDSSPPSQRRTGSSSTNQWDTRTDRNVFTAARGAGGGGRKGADDSSDEEPQKRLIRVVNDPLARSKAMSDVGAASASIKSKKSLGKKKPAKSSSDVGMTRPSTSAAMSPSTSTIASVETKQKIKRRSESMNAIDMLATPLPLPSTTKLPPTTAPRSSALSRSNTVTSSFSTTTIGTVNTVGGTAKPKRKKRISTASPPLPVLREPLTAADLASSLPSSRSYSIVHHDTGATRGEGGVLLGEDELVHGKGKAPSHLRETEKRVVKENIKYGVEGWVNKPSSPALGSSEAAVFQPTEQRENILAVVDRAEQEDTSRRYGSTTTPKWIKPAAASLAPSTTCRPRDSLQPPSATTLAKRKSVRMADLDPNSTEPPRSPAGSVRSDGPSTLSSGAIPRPGILVNHHPSPSQVTLNGPNGEALAEHSTWNMRSSSSAAFGTTATADDSSDEDEGEYALARKAFAKGTKKLELAGLPEDSPRRDKGKGRAVDQY